jgi:hypothetical protein
LTHAGSDGSERSQNSFFGLHVRPLVPQAKPVEAHVPAPDDPLAAPPAGAPLDEPALEPPVEALPDEVPVPFDGSADEPPTDGALLDPAAGSVGPPAPDEGEVEVEESSRLAVESVPPSDPPQPATSARDRAASTTGWRESFRSRSYARNVPLFGTCGRANFTA